MLYVNLLGYYSLNVQMTCEAQGLITSILVKFPGSVHDSQVFQASPVNQQLVLWPEGKGWILDRLPLRDCRVMGQGTGCCVMVCYSPCR